MKLIEMNNRADILSGFRHFSTVKEWIEPEVATSYYQPFCEYTERYARDDLDRQDSSLSEQKGFRRIARRKGRDSGGIN